MHDDAMSVWLIDAVLAVALIEAVALIGFNIVSGRGIGWRRLLPNLAAGLFLMAGIRVAVEGGSWIALALCLAGAGVAHGVDLLRPR